MEGDADLDDYPGKMFLSIGVQCSSGFVIQNFDLRICSYPFDWGIFPPKFVYEILHRLLETEITTDDLVRNYFFRDDARCVVKKNQENSLLEHYISCEGTGIVHNKLGNAIFPHDIYDENNIKKYVRRFDRLKTDIHNKSEITLIYVSQSSPTNGNFTIDGNSMIENVYENLNKIFLLVKKINKKTRMLVFDTIQDENVSLLNEEIQLYKFQQTSSWHSLLPQIVEFSKKNQIL